MDHKDLHGLTLDLHPQLMVLDRKFQREIRKRKEWCKTLTKPKPQIRKTGSQRIELVRRLSVETTQTK